MSTSTSATTPGSKKYKCAFPGCTYETDWTGNLKKHARVHSAEKPFACPDCPETFTQKPNLLRHMRTHMTNAPKFVCDVCDKKFAHQESLNIHKNKHDGVEFQCQFCDYKTYDPRNVAKHVKAKHS